MLPSHWLAENSHYMNEDPVWPSSFCSKTSVDPSPDGGEGGGGGNVGGGGGHLCEILVKWGVGVCPDRGVNPRGYGTKTRLLGRPQPQMYPPVALNIYMIQGPTNILKSHQSSTICKIWK